MALDMTPFELQDPRLRLQVMAESLGVDVPHPIFCPSDAMEKMCADAGVDVPPLLWSSPQVLAEAVAGGELAPEDTAPDWVPEGASIHIDLVGGTPQGRAWVDGTGEVDVDTLLGADANTEEGWSVTYYDPAHFTADGYVLINTVSFHPPALIGSGLSTVLAGATVVVRTKQVTTNNPTWSPLVALSADGNDAIEVDLYSSRETVATSWGGALSLTIPTIVSQGEGAVNCAAVTLTSDRCDIATNGSTALAGALTDSDRPAGNPLVAAVIDPGAQNALQSITIYDPLPDTDGLSELSEP